MLDSMITLSLSVAAIGAGLMAGVYFAFSGFIMRSLDQLGAAPATDAMNAINKCSASCCGDEGILVKKFEREAGLLVK